MPDMIRLIKSTAETFMDKTNILHKNLCIGRIISVIKSNNPHHHKLISVNGRHSDAFVYVISGSCSYRFDDGAKFEANTGDAFYLPYKSVYTMFIQSEDYKFIFCDFEFVEEGARGAAFCPCGNANIEPLFSRLLNLYTTPAADTYTECMSTLYSIYGSIRQNNSRAYLSKSKKDVMAAARRYIDEHFASPELSVSILAERVGVSEVYFRRLFKSQYGVSPIKYITAVRLKQATRLMKYPFLTLDECATQSGFSSLQYFSRIFKQEIGISPGRYRQDL